MIARAENLQHVRTFLGLHFPGVKASEFSDRDTYVFRLRTQAPPQPELVVSREVLADVGTVPFLDDDTAEALTRRTRVALTHDQRTVTERRAPTKP